ATVMLTLFVASEPPSAIAPAPTPAAIATETPTAVAVAWTIEPAVTFALVDVTVELSTRAVTESVIVLVASATASDPETQTPAGALIERVTRTDVVSIDAVSDALISTAPPVTELPPVTAASVLLPIVFVAEVTAPLRAIDSSPTLIDALTATGVAVMLDSSDAWTVTSPLEASTGEPSTTPQTGLGIPFTAAGPPRGKGIAPGPHRAERGAPTAGH